MDSPAETPRKLSRVSISDTHLPKFDVPQIHIEKGSLTRYFGNFITTGGSNCSLNSARSTDSMNVLHQQSSDLQSNQNHLLRKSATTGFALTEHSHTASYLSTCTGHFEGAASSFYPVSPEDPGLQMKSTSTNNFQRPMASTALASTLGVNGDEGKKPATLFGGLASFLSFDSLVNRPLQDVKDRESNYRLIMALDR